MEKLTKEQTSLFTVIAAIVMLLAFFAFKMPRVTPWELLTNGRGIGFLGYIFLILFLIMPVYLCLYAYRDSKQLEPLKPILNFPPKLVYACPIILFVVLIVYQFIDNGGASYWIYLLGAVAAFYIGQKSAE